MKKYPLPNLDGGRIRLNREWSQRNWFFKEVEEEFDKKEKFQFDLPSGWGNRWPELPNPDEEYSDFQLDKISLSKPNTSTNRVNILGYYMSWHIIGVSFQNEKGRSPVDGEELKSYNESLPIKNRFGIHICCKAINNYINKFSTDGLDPNQISNYLDYCTYLTMIYVISHEWGHYRSEVLSFQISNLIKSVSGEYNNRLAPSYLSYFVFKKKYPNSNFEEIFAEWSSLKLGIFNYYMKKPAFAHTIVNWPQVEATVKFMLSKAISRPNRIRPYSDIRFWVDFDSITKNVVMKRLSENKSSLNRSVNDNVLIDEIKSLKKGKIIDLLMHNQMQFSSEHQFNGVVQSAPLAYPNEPDSLFYHFGDDECLVAHKSSNSKNFLQLGEFTYFDSNDNNNSRIRNIIDGFKEIGFNNSSLPIKVFPELLPLDPVYFHE